MVIKIKNKKTKGIALVEVILALGISATVITTLVSLSLYALRSSLSAKLLLQGTKMATRESELLRVYRDSSGSWVDFVTAVQSCTNGTKCCTNPTGTSVNYSPCTEGVGVEQVTRYFTATKINGQPLVSGVDNIARINITAEWNLGGIPKSTHLYTEFTNWGH